MNELTDINATVGQQWATPQYNANGNMTSIPRPGITPPNSANLTVDQWSNLTVDEWSAMEVVPAYLATYDAWNRLVKLVDSGDGSIIQENTYDGRGYRIVVESYANGTLTETRHAYFTDDWQIVEERLGSSTTPDRHFVWGVRYIDDLVIRDRSVAGGTLNERLYAMQDGNWNMTAVADATGAVQERYEYDPYGETTFLAPNFTIRSTSSFNWETTYCGYRWDQSTGFFAVRNRFYHAQLGAWLSRDPIEWQAGPNFYSYVASNPLRFFDALGLSESTTIFKGDFGGDHVRIDAEPGSNPPIHAHCTPRGGKTQKVWWQGTRFDPIDNAMFKRLKSNPVAWARLKAAIKQAQKFVREQRLGKRSGSIVIAAAVSSGSVACAGFQGGPEAAAQEAANIPVDLATGVAASGAAGAATHIGLGAAGVSVTSGGTAVLGAGAAVSTTGVVAVGGAITAAAAGGYAAGTAIAHTQVGSNTISGHLGEAMYSACNWCFNW